MITGQVYAARPVIMLDPYYERTRSRRQISLAMIEAEIRSAWATYTDWLKGSTNRRIFGAAFTIGVLSAVVKLIIVAKELVIAAQFGTADALDAFLIAFIVPSFAVTVIAGSFNAALIPTYIQVRDQQGTQAAGELYSGIMVWSLGLLVLATTALLLAAPLYLPVLAGRFSPEKLALALHLLYLMSPLILLSGIITIWGAVLNAGEHFAVPALLPAFTPVAVVVAVLIGSKMFGIFALAVGTTCGAALEAAGLALALRRRGLRLRPVWYGLTPNVRHVIAQYVPMIAGAFLMGSTLLVNQAMAALLPSGSVAALNYGTRIVALPANLAAGALGTALMPYFSAMVAQRDWAGVRHTVNRYLRLAFLTTVPLTAALFLLSTPITHMVFQRGAFTAHDTNVVAGVQALASLQIPFYVAGIVVVRLISSMHANHILMWGSLLNLLVNVTLNYILMRYFGVAGIALSTSIVLAVSYVYLRTCAHRLLLNQANTSATAYDTIAAN